MTNICNRCQRDCKGDKPLCNKFKSVLKTTGLSANFARRCPKWCSVHTTEPLRKSQTEVLKMRQVFDGKLGERVRIESGDYYNQKTGRVVRKHPLDVQTHSTSWNLMRRSRWVEFRLQALPSHHPNCKSSSRM